MLNKDSDKRLELIEIMNTPYFNYEDEEVEELLKIEETKIESKQHEEEEKAEK